MTENANTLSPTQLAKSDIIAFAANHSNEITVIRKLGLADQEEAYSLFLDKEIERIVKLPPEDREMEIKMLVAWETDRIVGIKDPDIQKAAAIKHGYNNAPIAEYYKDLYAKNAELQQQDAQARGKVSAMGWGSFLAMFTGLTIVATRKDVSKRISPNTLFQVTAVVLTSILAGLLGRALGVELFSRGNRNESKALALESRDVFEKELDITIENKVHEMVAQKTGELASAENMGMAPGNMASTISQRNPSHMSQAMMDKMASQASVPHLA